MVEGYVLSCQNIPFDVLGEQSIYSEVSVFRVPVTLVHQDQRLVHCDTAAMQCMDLHHYLRPSSAETWQSVLNVQPYNLIVHMLDLMWIS